MSDKPELRPSGEVRASREVRASDSERQAVVDRLRLALDEGRLNLHEWDERVALAYRANTHAELEQLAADLPPDAAAVAVTKPPAPAKVSTGLPTPLRVLWTIWLSVVLINVVVWLLVSVSNMELVYFWPIWVAGPAGAALAGVTFGTTAIRGNRRAAEARRRTEQVRKRAR
jgi:hypothetical protein